MCKYAVKPCADVKNNALLRINNLGMKNIVDVFQN